MYNALRNRVQSCARSIRSFTLPFTALFSLSLASCGYVDLSNLMGGEENPPPAQEQLLAELEVNQQIWSQSGVTDYSFSLHKECDCPEELQTQHTVSINDEDSETLEEHLSEAVDDESNKLRRTKVQARDDDDGRSRRQVNPLRVENIFTDLRRAILQNQVQQVSYDPVYGFPQNVLLNSAISPNSAFLQALNDDYDDDRPFPVSNLTIQTRDFQVRNALGAPRNIALNGQFIRQTNPNTTATEYWLIGDNGQWNQLNVPTTLNSSINGLTNQSYVQVNGQWIPGGINGQGRINLQQISSNQTIPFQNNLNGTLYYRATNDSFAVDDFYITNDAGQSTFLNVPNDLRNRAFGLAGQRVNLSGNWNGSFNTRGSRFNPSQFNTINTSLERFSGILNLGSTYPIPGIPQNNYVLVDDFGGILELQIPSNLMNNVAYSVGQRVEVLGTRVFAGNFGQPIVYVQSLNSVQNVFTTTQIVGTITSVSNPGSFLSQVLLQTETGVSINLWIPSQFSDPFNPIAVGMRVIVDGAWVNGTAVGFGTGTNNSGIFEARAPIQIIDFGLTATTSYTGFISNVGSFNNGVSCNATQTTYTFTTETGQSLQLYVTGSTRVDGLTGQQNIPYQARVQVTGTMLSPGVLQAQAINVFPQAETTIIGTIIEIGPNAGNFTCVGSLNTYRLLDQFGNAYSISLSPNSLIQGGVGGPFLRIGDTVQVTGSLTGNSSSFYARQVYVVGAIPGGFPVPPPFGSPPPFPNPIPFPAPNAVVSVMGTVTGLDCSDSFSDTYIFVDQSGMIYKLRVDSNILPGAPFIDVGSYLQVSGSLLGEEIFAQQISQVAFFADPVDRIPVSGTILSQIDSLPTSCGFPVITYQFQADTGQMYLLRLTYEAALHQTQPIFDGTRIVVLSHIDSINPQLMDGLEIQITGTQPFNFGNFNQSVSLFGTVTTSTCGNEIYFVDQNGNGYQVQLPNGATTGFYAPGTKVNITGQMAGNRLVASNLIPDTNPAWFAPPPPQSGTITSTVTTETLSCGTSITTFSFQNDNGRVQQLRVANNISASGQYLAPGSRIYITNLVESLGGNVIDALSISQQGFF